MLAELDNFAKLLFTDGAAPLNTRLAARCKELLAEFSEGAAMLKVVTAQHPTVLAAGDVAVVVVLGATGVLPAVCDFCYATLTLAGVSTVFAVGVWGVDSVIAKAVGGTDFVDTTGLINEMTTSAPPSGNLNTEPPATPSTPSESPIAEPEPSDRTDN